MATQPTCKDRVQKRLKGRIEDIEKLWQLYCKDPESYDAELGNFSEYGLCLEYVAPGTFGGQRRGYIRYQLSWGGPSDEFRFYLDENLETTRIEYWFMDWFDGAKIILKGRTQTLLEEIYRNFKECGAIEAKIQEARS